MLGGDKKKSKEVRWMLTFADLITLLFCFFVYLSLFNKPQVNLKTDFILTDKGLSTLSERLPSKAVLPLPAMKDQLFEMQETFVEKLETLLDKKLVSLYKTQILIESVAVEKVKESVNVVRVGVLLNEVVEDDLVIPLFFSGSARKGKVNSEWCNENGLNVKVNGENSFDYILGADKVVIPKGDKIAYINLCLVNDDLYENAEEIRIQIGTLRGDVERGNFVTKRIMIQDDEPTPEVSFEVNRREIYKGTANITVGISPISGVKTLIPLNFEGTAKQGEDFRFLDGSTIEIHPFTEKGTIEVEILQDEVPLYATRTLAVSIKDDLMKNAEPGKFPKQINTIVGALEMKDCSGIHRFLRENRTFSSFELNASKSRCILTLPSHFLFPSGGTEIEPKVSGLLKSFLRQIRDRYELEGDAIKVEGHTDDLPLRKNSKFKDNWELSVIRASNVAHLMMKKVGYKPSLISISGHADTRPKEPYFFADGKPKLGKQLKNARKLNRRVDLVFTRPPQKEQTRKFFPNPRGG